MAIQQQTRPGRARFVIAAAVTVSLGATVGSQPPPASATGQATYSMEMISPITTESILIEGPSEIASNTAGTLFIAEQTGRIIRVDSSSSAVVYRTPLHPIGDGTYSNTSPGDIAADEAGNLYIADPTGHRIHRLTPFGVLSVAAGAGSPAGSPSAGFDPTLIAFGRDGFLYSVDEASRQIIRFGPDGTANTMIDLTTVPNDALGNPFGPVLGLAVNASGTVHFCDSSRIQQIANGGTVEPFTLDPEPTRGCSNLGVDSSGTLFIESFNLPSSISKFPPPTATYPTHDTMGSFDFSVRGDGTIDVVGDNSHGVFSLPPNGSLTAVSSILDTAADSYNPTMISRGPGGVIQMGESSWAPTYPVRELTGDDTIVEVDTVGPFSRRNPQVHSLTVGSDASYLLTVGTNLYGNPVDPAWQGYLLTRIDGTAQAATTTPVSYWIDKVHAAPDGSLWYQVRPNYPGFTNPVLVRLDTTGGETMMLGEGVGPTIDGFLTGLAFATDGSAYFTENATDAVHVRRPDGSFAILTHLAGFPADTDSNGRVLMVTEAGGLAWAETDGTITSVQVPGGFPGPVADAVADGNDIVILVEDGLTNRVARLRSTGGGPTTTTTTSATSTTADPVPACGRSITSVAPSSHVEGLTARLYMAYFLRQPDVEGYEYWSGAITAGASARDLSWGFAESTEFQLRYANLSNRGFVDLIYANVMCREPDGEGYEYWLGLLDRGEIMRSDLMLYFADSTEFVNLTGTPS